MSSQVQESPLSTTERYSGLAVGAGVGVLFAGVLLGTSSGLVAVPQPPHAEGTSWFTASPAGLKPAPPLETASVTTTLTNSEMLEQLRDAAGLTWDQTARIFNVSRRSVHLWLAGGRMSAGNEERLVEIVRVVDALHADTPEQRRHLLLQPRPEGKSAFDSFRSASASSETDINRNLEPLANPDPGGAA